MTDEDMQNLAKEIEQWLVERGATVVSKQTFAMLMPPEWSQEPVTYAESAPTGRAKSRWLYICEEPIKPANATWCPPVLWEEGCKHITRDTSEVFIRNITYAPAEQPWEADNPLPARIKVRLSVIVEEESTR